ncbi:hypothetical protein AAE478_008911 [Parahypoxylon ruwenzoriense]
MDAASPPSEKPPQHQAALQYTTVGSVWSPQSLPLQPPVRRGRATKSSFVQPYSDEPSSTHYYSPLQQNFDRAVSPHPPNLTERIAILERGATLERDQTLQFLSMSPQQVVSQPHPYPLPQPVDRPAFPGKQPEAEGLLVDEDHSQQIDENNDTDNPLIHMPTKSLTNLASYPNPMQKAAQRILERARQPHHTMANQAPDFEKEYNLPVAGPATGLRNAHPDPSAMARLPQSDRIDEYSGPYRSLGPRDPSLASPYARDTYNHNDILSKGPGAPQPLTAGPPGQRQYRPSVFDPTGDGSRKDMQKPRGLDENMPIDHPHQPFQSLQPSQAPQHQRPMYPTSGQASSSYQSEGYPSIQAPVGMGKASFHSNDKMFDSLPPEEAEEFYPHGLPSNYNYQPSAMGGDWWAQKLNLLENAKQPEPHQRDALSRQRDPSFQAAHKEKLYSDFYAGTRTFTKSLDALLRENTRHDFVRTVGNAPNKVTQGNNGNGLYRQLTIEEANDIAIHKHAEPLLGMLYQNMVKHSGVSPVSHTSESDDTRSAVPERGAF